MSDAAETAQTVTASQIRAFVERIDQASAAIRKLKSGGE